MGIDQLRCKIPEQPISGMGHYQGGRVIRSVPNHDDDWSPISKRQRLSLSVLPAPRLQHLTWKPWSVARCHPSERVTDIGVVRSHLLRPEQATQFARVIADRLHIIGGDLQQPASALAMATQLP